MAFVTDTQFSGTSNLVGALTAPFKVLAEKISNAMVLSMEASSRAAQIEELNRKTDRELEDIGINREDIARLVYADILYL